MPEDFISDYKSPGKFIVLEGLDGAGTTTQAQLLATWLTDHGVPTLLTNEPTSGAIGRLIRQIIESHEPTAPSTLALLFAADRDQHLHDPTHGLLKQIEQGTWVVCDRYLLSTLAYQTAEGAEMSDLLAFNRLAPDPDLTIFLDVSPTASLGRVRQRGSSTSRFETEATLGAVWSAYNEFRRMDRGLGELVVVDGHPGIQEVAERVRTALRSALASDPASLARLPDLQMVDSTANP